MACCDCAFPGATLGASRQGIGFSISQRIDGIRIRRNRDSLDRFHRI